MATPPKSRLSRSSSRTPPRLRQAVVVTAIWIGCAKKRSPTTRSKTVARELIFVTLGAIEWKMRAGVREIRIASIQDQGVRTFRRPRRIGRCRSLRGSKARREGLDRCQSRRQCHQTAHRSERRWQVWRVPNDYAVPPGPIGILRLRVRHEQLSEPAPERTRSLSAAGGRNARDDWRQPRSGAEGRNDCRGDMR